ncbi:MAG: hypothetical protein WCW27_03250 [Patescibacteria group bacterium]
MKNEKLDAKTEEKKEEKEKKIVPFEEMREGEHPFTQQPTPQTPYLGGWGAVG